MGGISQEDKDSAVYVLPAGYSEHEFEMSEEQIAFDQFKQEATDNENYSKLLISRVPMNRHGQRGSQKLHFLFECAVDEYTYSQLLSKLRDEYGTGYYKIQGRNERGQLKLNKTVAVEAPKVDTATASADTGQAAVIEQVSNALREHSEQQRELIQSMMPKGNSVGSMKDTIEMLTGLMAVFQQPQRTLIEQLAEIKMVKEMFGGDDSGIGGEANMWTAMAEGLKAFGGPIAQALAAGAQTGELDKSGIVRLPAPKMTEAETVTDQEKHDIAMRKNIQILIQNAKTKIPPDMFANILVNNTPEEKQDELWEFISNEKCVDTIIALEPEAEPYRDWFEQLREAVIGLMSDPEDDALDNPQDEIVIDAAQEQEAMREAAKGASVLKNPTKENPDGDRLQPEVNGDTLPESGDASPAVAGDTDLTSSEDKDSASSDSSDGDTTGDT